MKHYIGITFAFAPWIAVIAVVLWWSLSSLEHHEVTSALTRAPTPGWAADSPKNTATRIAPTIATTAIQVAVVIPSATREPPTATLAPSPTNSTTAAPYTPTAAPSETVIPPTATIEPNVTLVPPTVTTQPSLTPIPPTATMAPSTTPALPTVTPVLAHELRNGDFEQTGNDETWQTIGDGTILSDASLAHSGNGFASLGGTGFDRQGITQEILVSSTSPYLSYWDRTSSDYNDCYIDTGHIRVKADPNGTTSDSISDVYDFCEDKAHNQWRHHIVDLRAYAGKIITLQIDMSTDNAFGSYWALDDISFQANP